MQHRTPEYHHQDSCSSKSQPTQCESWDEQEHRMETHCLPQTKRVVHILQHRYSEDSGSSYDIQRWFSLPQHYQSYHHQSQMEPLHY